MANRTTSSTTSGKPREQGQTTNCVTRDAAGDCFWTERETAAYLGIAPKTLRAWRGKRSDLPFHRVGGRMIRYRRGDVEAFVARSVRTSTSDHGGR